MRRRILLALVLGIGLCIGSPARAAITAFWQSVTITPEAITNDPALASMQSWDLMATSTGDWVSAGLRAVLPTGSFFYKHTLGGFKHPSPGAIEAAAGLAFTSYVNTPNDNGLNNENTLLQGGFKDPIPSLGDATAPRPGEFSVAWGDLFVDSPGTYQIARLTFPHDILPNIADNGLPRSRTSQIAPDAITFIPDIPEPLALASIGIVGLLALFGRPAMRRGSGLPMCETLEARRTVILGFVCRRSSHTHAAHGRECIKFAWHRR